MKNPVKFGKYYLLERISVGGMAEVFKAKSFGEAGFERLVAVKRILPSIAEDQEFIAMFVDEAKLAVQLTHPNIAQIFELGKVGEAYFIALEYVAGKDMRAIFERARKRTETIPIPMACYMVMKLCEGLDYAHNKKDAAGRSLELVHRDVSPQNMLVSYDGDVKLIDFGIAKAASKSSKTQAGILKGKFGYMSPEQVRGLTVDRRSDVFAVGICLYELLTMERLFVGESDFSTLEKVRNVEIMPPSTYNKKIPEELEAIVLKALAKHPEDRYRTAMDLHDDLQSFMYTSGNFFARKDLASYQHRLFGEEISKEAARDEEYKKFDSRRASDLEVFEGAGAPQPPMAQGRQGPPAPPPAPPVRPASAAAPPPPPPRAPSKTVMGVGNPGLPMNSPSGSGRSSPTASPVATSSTSAAVARMAVSGIATPPPAPMSGVQAAVATLPVQLTEMDWDEEELETQVFDKPEGLPSGPYMPPPAPPRASAAPRHTASIPVVPALPQIPSIPAGSQSPRGSMQTNLGIAPPPPPTSSLPGAPMPSTSLPAVPFAAMMPGATMGAPAIGAPVVPSSQIAVSAPMSMPPGRPGAPAVPAPSYPGAVANNHAASMRSAPPVNGRTSDWPAGASNLSLPGRRDNTSVVVFAFLGVLLVAGAVLFFLRFTHGEPVGSLAVTTNVGGVAVLVDDQPQIGNGQSFAVNNLSSQRIHRVVVRKPGFRTFQQDVPVVESQITPMQVVLEPEPSLSGTVPPVLPSFQAPPIAQPVAQPVAQLPSAVAPVPQVAQPPSTGVPPVVPPTPATPPAAPPTGSAQASTQAHGPASHTTSHPGVAMNRPTAARPVHGPAAAPVPAMPVATAVTPVRPAAAAASGAPATLRISTRPAAQCTINGETFSTPSIRHLPPGSYRITCHNDDLQARSTWSVTLHDGEDVRDLNHALDN